mmetsp:Transcript_21961/g.26759  ORF Transcript_21961/g.26759 Transcript_21961/m.26759 type:complete len:110 (-) Transcript_21961:22-351(-)
MNFLEKVVTNFPGLNNSSQSQASDSGCRDSDSKNQKNNRDRTRTPSPKAFSQFLKSGTKHKPSSGAESSLNENRWSSVGARYRGSKFYLYLCFVHGRQVDVKNWPSFDL